MIGYTYASRWQNWVVSSLTNSMLRDLSLICGDGIGKTGIWETVIDGIDEIPET